MKTSRLDVSPSRRTAVLVVSGLVLTALVGAIVVGALARVDNDGRALALRQIPAEQALQATGSASARAQNAFLVVVGDGDKATRAAALGDLTALGTSIDKAWKDYVALALGLPGERELQQQYVRTEASLVRSSGALAVDPPKDKAVFDSELKLEQAQAASVVGFLHEIDSRYYDPTISASAQRVVDSASGAVELVYSAAGVAAALFLLLGAAMFRSARRDERHRAVAAREHEVAVRHTDIETRLQRGLEMEGTEQGTYDVIEQALRIALPSSAVEFLVADSSRAHFRRVLQTRSDAADMECRVGGPFQCPVARAGQVRFWDDSSRLDTCPFLRGRDAPVWACCVPVNIVGRSTGVIHAQAPLAEPSSSDVVSDLQIVAGKAGDRIGVLRVLARTEAEAQADPLTGLANRRNLEDRSREILDSDRPFVVAFIDLDRFKDLNDTYGHDTGDRALRTFSRVLRDGVRPRDIPSRWGGEEFVVLLPDCALPDARIVLERIRVALAESVDHGSVPPFTISAGLAAAEPGELLSEVIDRADAALLEAKARGRDRVVSAVQPADGTERPYVAAPTMPAPPATPSPPPARPVAIPAPTVSQASSSGDGAAPIPKVRS